MKTIRVVAAIAAVSGLFSVSGCSASGGEGDTTNATAGGTVTINFLHAQPEGTYDDAIAAFESANPTIKVQQEIVPFDQLNPAVQQRVGGGDASVDLYAVDEPRVPAFAARGWLVDLSDVRDEAAQNVPSNAIDAASYNDTLFALPQWTSTQLLYYNLDLLEQASVPAPSPDPDQRWTWEELTDAARQAQQAGAAHGFSFEQVDRYYQLQPLFESLGAGSGLTGAELLEPDVANAGWVEAMDWYRSLYEEGISPRGVTPEQTPNLFTTGQLAFFVGGPWNLAAFTGESTLRFGIAPQPYFEGGEPVTPTDSWAIGISPSSEHQDAALAFAKYVTLDPAGAEQGSLTLPLPPVQDSAFQTYLETNTASGGDATAPFAELVQYELQNTAVSRPRSVGFVEFEEALNRAFADIRNGSAASERLASAESELTDLLSRLSQ